MSTLTLFILRSQRDNVYTKHGQRW